MTSDTQLELFPEWDKQQDFINSSYWKNNERACFTIKEDIIKPAFKDLRAKGYICRMNFLCCGTCASYELSNMAEERGKIGMVYWHKQDQERMIENRSVYFGYGSRDEKVVSSEDVGRHVVNSLKVYINDTGLPVTINWTESALDRIRLDWTG